VQSLVPYAPGCCIRCSSTLPPTAPRQHSEHCRLSSAGGSTNHKSSHSTRPGCRPQTAWPNMHDGHLKQLLHPCLSTHSADAIDSLFHASTATTLNNHCQSWSDFSSRVALNLHFSPSPAPALQLPTTSVPTATTTLQTPKHRQPEQPAEEECYEEHNSNPLGLVDGQQGGSSCVIVSAAGSPKAARRLHLNQQLTQVHDHPAVALSTVRGRRT